MFSPLALTQTLPFLPLAQGDIDYQVARRGDPDLFDTLFADPVTKVILVRGGLLAVPRGQGNAVNYASANMRLSTLPGAYAAPPWPSIPKCADIPGIVWRAAQRACGGARHHSDVDPRRGLGDSFAVARRRRGV